MAYSLVFRKEGKAKQFLRTFRKKLERSRFRVGAIDQFQRRDQQTEIRLEQIRLRQLKDYCGSHPGPCPVSILGPRPHKRYTFLEGTDWVSFNDFINNILDRQSADADVRSSRCWVRKGTRRRVVYQGDFPEWAKDEDADGYTDCCGQRPPVTEYPEGTPGIYGWKRPRSRRSRRDVRLLPQHQGPG